MDLNGYQPAVARVVQDFKCVSGSAVTHTRLDGSKGHRSRESSFDVLRSISSHEADPQVV